MSEEMDLGSREKSPERVELTPGIEIEGGRLSGGSEVSQEQLVGKTPSDLEIPETEMSGIGLEKSDSQKEKVNDSQFQTMLNMIQQMLQQELKENSKKSEEKIAQQFQQQKENSKQSEERVVSNCQRSQEKLNKELVDKVATDVEKVTTKVEKVAVEMDQVKQDLKKWQGVRTRNRTLPRNRTNEATG
jgi:superfamily II RNA helicase